MWGTRSAAMKVYKAMQERNYSTQAWSEQPLHPKLGRDVDEVGLVNFIFTMDLLNFSFWSELDGEHRFQVEYQGRRWTGYSSLVACLRRALAEGIAITTPRTWRQRDDLDELMRHVFRSATDEEVPLLHQRIAVLREAALVLDEVSRARSIEDEPALTVQLFASGDKKDEGAGRPSMLAASMRNVAKQDPVEREVASASIEDDQAAVAASVEDTEGTFNGEAQTATSASVADDEAATHSVDHVDTAPGPPNPSIDKHPPPLHSDPPQTLVHPDMSVVRLIQEADHSAGKLVNLLAKHFPCFQDEDRFEGRKVRFLKRAQIFVADMWAAFNRASYGEFHDIDQLTMFAGKETHGRSALVRRVLN